VGWRDRLTRFRQLLDEFEQRFPQTKHPRWVAFRNALLKRAQAKLDAARDPNKPEVDRERLAQEAREIWPTLYGIDDVLRQARADYPLVTIGYPISPKHFMPLRARTTVELMAEAGGWTCPVHVTRELYESHPEAVLRRIRSQSDDYASLLVAGHEPTWSDLVAGLTGGRARMVTAAVARIDFFADRWQDVDFGVGLLMWLVPPKLLQATRWAP